MSAKKILGVVLLVAAVAVPFVGLPLLAVAAIEVGIALAQNFILGPKKPKNLTTDSQSDRLTATLVPTEPRKIVFGHTAMGTDVRYQAFTGANQEYLDMIVCHASHKVQSIDELWLDNEIAWNGTVQGRYAGYLTVATVLEGNSSNGIAIDSTWTSTCTLTGCAYSHYRFKLTGNSSSEQSPFASGVTSRMTVRGKGALRYDPRLDSTVTGGSGSHRANDQTTWAWDDNGSRNPALQELWYEIGWKIGGKLAVGKGVPPARIDLAAYAVAANLCDESIALNGGGTEPRYRADGVVSEGDDPSSVRDNLCQSMNAVLRDAGGKLALSVLHNDLATPAAPFGKSAFDDDDVLGELQWDQTPDLSSTFNVIRGRMIDASNVGLYQATDFPEVSLASNDGIDRIDTIEFPFVQSNGQAQRLAKQRLERGQYQGKLTFSGKPSFWGVNIGDVFAFSHQAFGWSSKLFRCAGQTISRTGETKMVAVEENAAIYAWDNSEAAPVTPGTPTVYNPLNSAILTALGAPGDSNRTRFSLLERGTLGWGQLFHSTGLTVAFATNTDGTTGKPCIAISGTFTATGQSASVGTTGFTDAAFRIPVTAGERLFVGARIGGSVPTGGSWQLAVGWIDAAGSVISEPVVVSGSGSPAFGTPVGDFVVAPSNATGAWIEAYALSGTGTGAFLLYVGEPLVCGAGSAQTLRPAFTPGPSGEFGADVTALIDLPATVTIYADSTGTPKTGELPKPIVGKYLRSGTALSSGVTWSKSTTEGNATSTISGSGAADLEITGPNNSTLALESVIEVTGTYQGIARKASITVLRSDDPPTSSGGGGGGGGGSGSSGSTTTLGDTTGTSYDLTNAISSTITATAGFGGQVACTAPLSFKRTGVTLGSGPDGENGAAGKWQWRIPAGTWADIASEVTSVSNSVTDVDPDTGKHRTFAGSLSVAQTKTGLTSGTAYEFRFCWRRVDAVATYENVSAVGTLQAIGS
jgi:hypothetical protein